MIDLWEEEVSTRVAQGVAQGTLAEARRAVMLLVKSCKLEMTPDFEEKLDTIDNLERLHRILEQIPHVRSTAKLGLN